MVKQDFPVFHLLLKADRSDNKTGCPSSGKYTSTTTPPEGQFIPSADARMDYILIHSPDKRLNVAFNLISPKPKECDKTKTE